MTPMIDVVFLLIIFFLVASHLAKQENSVQLDLPVADTGLNNATEVESLVVNILPDGQWQSGGISLNLQSLAALLRSRASASTDPLRLKIRSDQNITYDRLEPILKEATAAGIGDIVFSVYEAQGG